MGKTAAALALAVAMFAGPAFGHRSKRTDKCGCHHQYGLVHCHPNLKSNRCEAPVADKKPADAKADEAEKTNRQQKAPQQPVRL